MRVNAVCSAPEAANRCVISNASGESWAAAPQDASNAKTARARITLL
jgi:hypothetical protein